MRVEGQANSGRKSSGGLRKAVGLKDEEGSSLRVGLALGGGAARGIAHLGVLQVLWERGISIGAIAGTSAGAVVGALIAAGFTPPELIEIAKSSNWWFLARGVSLKTGLLHSSGIEKWLNRYLDGKGFADLEIPLAVVASDLVRGETVVFRQGDVAWAVRVSCTVPGIYAPVECQGRFLVDGGLTENVPVDTVLAMDVDRVLAVSLNGSFLDGERPERPADVMQQAISILQRAHVKEQLGRADLVIAPELAGLGLTDFDAVDDFVRLGREAMEQALPQLESMLEKGSLHG
ncbi:MAG: patatin-like phospholipase family protein [Firmicutes bacterium]|nr:patatin-like phospholipase family protein [Bacillota bacterium]